MAKNPLLQKKFEEGRAIGRKEGIAQSTAFFVEKFKALEQMPGVGPKTLEKVKEALGKQYFK
ncbi:MAG: hypothetical protein ABS917_11195 [Solibacillus sp.]|uniref:hypothetical protein n=1 Tax=Solibacillus sp. TaxID=1909654 RepID=UPI003315FFDD